MSATLTAAQLAYFDEQILGRIATIDPDGPQVRPVGFSVDAEAGVIEIGGHDLPATRKWRNVRADARVAFVVDDLASTDPWRPRALEVRGTAAQLQQRRSGSGIGHDQVVDARVHGWTSSVESDTSAAYLARRRPWWRAAARTSSPGGPPADGWAVP